jgi:hypothetical protein
MFAREEGREVFLQLCFGWRLYVRYINSGTKGKREMIILSMVCERYVKTYYPIASVD